MLVTAEGFPDTVWDEVRRARERDGVIAIASLARIATRYWYPVYYLIRQKSCGRDEARALTETFFQSFLEQELLNFDPKDMGKFREFLVASVNLFLDPRRPEMPRQPRDFALPFPSGPDHGWRPFEASEGEGSEDAFMRNWAKCMMDFCVTRLRDECRESGADIEAKVFEARYLGGKLRGTQDVVGALSGSLGLDEAEVQVLLERAEQRFKRIVREEVMTWVATPEEGLEEIADLLSRFG